MKTRFSLRPLVLLALLLTLGCCKKDKDPTPLERLPAATTEGKNTWGCLVNGEAWTSSGSDNMRADWTVPDGMSIGMSFSTRFLSLSFPDSTRRYSIPTGCKEIVKPGLFGPHARVHIVSKIYNANEIVGGDVCLNRLDRQAGVASGTFQFTIAKGPGDTLRVTNGRFDIGNMDR